MTISLEFEKSLAVISIDDGNKNVFNHSLLDELELAWEKAQREAKAIC